MRHIFVNVMDIVWQREWQETSALAFFLERDTALPLTSNNYIVSVCALDVVEKKTVEAMDFHIAEHSAFVVSCFVLT